MLPEEAYFSVQETLTSPLLTGPNGPTIRPHPRFDVDGCAIGLPFGPKHFKFFHKAVEFLDCKMRYLTCRIGVSLAGVRLARYVPRLFY